MLYVIPFQTSYIESENVYNNIYNCNIIHFCDWLSVTESANKIKCDAHENFYFFWI